MDVSFALVHKVAYLCSGTSNGRNRLAARVIAAWQMGADCIIAMSRHEDRQKLALEFGALTLSQSVARKVSRRSRNSPMGSARTRSSRRSEPRSR
jgi:hypothetical protein